MSGATITAREAGLIACTVCGKAARPEEPRCPRCNAHLHAEGRQPLNRVWAWLLAGMILYIPANVYPMLITQQFGKATGNTVVGGVIELIHYEAYAVAAIVFTASVMIPISKFVVIAGLTIIAQRGARITAHRAHQLYEFVEFIGRWSMIDVFVVAILGALVQMGFLASIEPGVGAPFFAASVAFTMMASKSFDPRLIWDMIGDRHE